MPRTGLLLGILVLCCGIACSCEEDGTRPDNVLRRFLQAAAYGTPGDIEVVFSLLTPEAQAKLRKLAALATAQSGGRQRYRASDLLATTLAQGGRTFTIKVLSEDDQRAKLQASAPKRPSEIWHLRRLEGRWRVELPNRAMDPPATSAPATRQAGPATSAPATRQAGSAD